MNRNFMNFAEKIGLWHILFGGILYIVTSLLTMNVYYGLIFVVAFYFGRERRDYEIKEKIPTSKWYAGWTPWKWSFSDLFPVCIFYSFLSIFIKLYFITLWSKLWD